mmetsp:Transcript_33023/g.49224  ORF Transcript_33023/g.49224 Transcript_33023/m.49224 type:complete len:93 (-) Transcript_33023:2671-2949(-)
MSVTTKHNPYKKVLQQHLPLAMSHTVFLFISKSRENGETGFLQKWRHFPLRTHFLLNARDIVVVTKALFIAWILIEKTTDDAQQDDFSHLGF